MSEMMYARRGGNEDNGTRWHLFDFHKIWNNYPLEILDFGRIDDGASIVDNNSELMLLEPFSPTGRRRRNLKNLQLKCGLVVSDLIRGLPLRQSEVLSGKIIMKISQIAFPELYSKYDEPTTDHIDIVTKATIPISLSLREDLNFKYIPSEQFLQINSPNRFR